MLRRKLIKFFISILMESCREGARRPPPSGKVKKRLEKTGVYSFGEEAVISKLCHSGDKSLA